MYDRTLYTLKIRISHWNMLVNYFTGQCKLSRKDLFPYVIYIRTKLLQLVVNFVVDALTLLYTTFHVIKMCLQNLCTMNYICFNNKVYIW